MIFAGSWLLQRPRLGGRDPNLVARVPAQPSHPSAHVPQEQTEQQETERAHTLQWLSLQKHLQVGENEFN